MQPAKVPSAGRSRYGGDIAFRFVIEPIYTAQAALLLAFTVEVVARFKPEVDLMKAIFDDLPSRPSGVPNFGPLAQRVDVAIGTISDPEAPTLTVT